MVNSSEHGVSRVVHHKDYYLRGGDMTVLVENHLYRIHSYFFERESLFFRQKFVAGPADDGEGRGSNDSDAYTLEDVKSEDFARFLWVFYNPKYSIYEAPLETWLSILRLATRWGFNSVKELTVRELEKLEIESIEKIAIYHEYGISKLYLIPSYITVVKRVKPLSFTEGMKLGMETVLRVADARERARQHASESGIRTPSFDDFEDSEVELLVREVFNLGTRPTSPTPSAMGPTPIPHGPSTAAIKLNAAPKTNGAASRSNGVSADKNSVDPMLSFTSAMVSQASTGQPTPPAPAKRTTSSTPARQPATTPEPTATAMAPKPPAPASTTSTEKSVPLLPQLTVDKKDKGAAQGEGDSAPSAHPGSSSVFSPLSKASGLGEPSSLVEGLAASFHNVASSGTSSVTPSDGNNDVTVSKENGCDHKNNEQPEEAEKKPDVPKKDDIESEQTKNTATKDEQPKQSDKDEQQVKADDLTKDADKDETQHVLSDSESTRGGKGPRRKNRSGRGGNKK